MRLIIISFLFICVFLNNFTLSAQQGNDTPDNLGAEWSLQECIETAIKNNVGVKQSELQVIGSRVSLEQAKADRWPSLNGNVGYNYSVGRSINPYNNLYETDPVTSQNYGLSANVMLFNSFSKHNTIRRNKTDLATSQYNLEDTKNNITLDVISAYTQIVFNQELLENARIRIQTTEVQLERTRKMVEAGSLPQANLLQLQAQRASDELEIINTQNNLNLSKLQLKQYMQIPANREFDVVIPDVPVPDEADLVSTAEGVYETALETQPSIKGAESQITSAEYDVVIAKANRYPYLSASGGISTAYSSIAPPIIPKPGAKNITTVVPTGAFIRGNPEMIVVQEQTVPTEFTENTYFNQLDFNLRQYVGVNLTIPIFNNFQVRTAVSNAEINLESRRLNAINERNLLRQEIEQAYANAKAAATSYAARERQVASLQEAFRSTETRYTLGGVNALEFTQAQNELNAAESDLIRAKYDYIFSLKILDFYEGKPIDFE